MKKKKKETQVEKMSENKEQDPKVVSSEEQENNDSPSVESAESAAPSSVSADAETEKKALPAPSLLGSIWQGLVSRQIFHKIFTLFFALAVFGAVYFYMVGHRNILTYMGIMLLMVVVYAEILVIRDHLWVIEGSMRESRKWRDVFFNQTTLRRQRFRKIIIMLFALGIFSYVYMKSIKRDPVNTPVLSFMGIILMITILYYEILTIRDEVFIMLQSLKVDRDEDEETNREKHYQQFLEQQEEEKAKESDSADPKTSA